MAAFLPDLAKRLGTTAISPLHADIAGAVGTVISAVTEEIEFLIRSRTGGGYVVFGPDFKKEFSDLDTAKEYALEASLKGIVEKSRAGGMTDCIAQISLEDESLDLADGMHYMETRIHGAARAIVES